MSQTSASLRSTPAGKWRRRSLAALGALAAGLAVLLSFCNRQSEGEHEASGPTAEPHVPAAGIPIIDVHVHASPKALSRLRKIMAARGISHAVNLSGGDPLSGLQEQVAAAARHKSQIITFCTLAYGQAKYPDYGARMAHLVRASYALGARGLKIAKILGLGLSDRFGERIPVDAPQLDVVFETAGELGMPVAIHTGDPEAFWLPVDERNPRRDELTVHPGWALYGKGVPSFDELLTELEARIARHPKTTFIAVHFGNAAERPAWVAGMLRKYPNLYIDTAARIPELGRHPPAEMRAFFLEFQDRILYGSDLGVGPGDTPLFLGSSGRDAPTSADEERFFGASRRFFETADVDFDHPTPIQGNWKISGIDLPRAVLRKVYRDNAARMLRVD